MEPSTIEIRVRRAEDLRAWWLDGFPDGGMFVPGLFALSAGSPVLVRVVTELPTAANTLLTGMVVWRRLPQRNEAALTSPNALRAGLGIAFDSTMRNRLLFLERLGRDAAHDGRSGMRYPTHLVGEVAIREGERAAPAQLLDVSPRGARLAVPESVTHSLFVQPGGEIRLRVAPAISGESSLAPLIGRVAWLGPDRDDFGVRLELGSKDERLHWAKVVTRAREEIERHAHLVDRLVG